MSALSTVEARLPPGFRFHPRDDELVCDYLEKKISGRGDSGSYARCSMMVDVDLNRCEPWDLPDISCVGGKEWYFFSLRDRKYATGQRTNRATQSGYWKATGKDRPVTRKGALVGMRKTLVFYQGRAPKGKKTDWVMHEFRTETNAAGPQKISTKEDWVLCRVFFKTRSTAPARTAAGTFFYEGGSLSLPPLTDTAHMAGDRAHGSHRRIPANSQEFRHELQVPCFSNSIQGPTAAVAPHPPPPLLPACHLASDAGPRLMKAMLSHLPKLEGGWRRGASMGMEEGVVESYLSTEAGLQSMW